MLSAARRALQQPAPVVATLLAGLVTGFLGAALTSGGAASDGGGTAETAAAQPPRSHPRATDRLVTGRPASAAQRQQQAPAAASPPAGAAGDAPWRSELGRALERGETTANALGGSVSAAIWVSGWSDPVVVGDRGPMRMWSISKVVTALAVFEASGAPSQELSSSLERALTRSENCAQRRVIVGLQELTGGAEAARERVAGVLERAGVRSGRPEGPRDPEGLCHDYLTEHGAGLDDAFAPAYQYGTATWTIADAVAFAHALASGRYGEPGERVLELLRRPKAPSADLGAGNLRADPAWGAGSALADLRPAYKAGWGGTTSSPPAFVAAQIAVVEYGGAQIALAVAFRPHRQPAADDPAQEQTAVAVETVMAAVAAELRKLAATR